MPHRTSNLGWAIAIVATSLVAAYLFDAAGLQWPARAASAPVYPMLLAVLRVAGGFHAASRPDRMDVRDGSGVRGGVVGVDRRLATLAIPRVSVHDDRS